MLEKLFREEIRDSDYHEGYHCGFWYYPAPMELWPNLNTESNAFKAGFETGYSDAKRLKEK